jgi:hypothetical protein
MNQHRARRHRMFRPEVESLENRWCPSVSAGVFFNTLVVVGDSAGNTVTISDNGAGGVSATITGSTGSASASGTGITNVLVSTKGGNDSVTFNLTGALKSKLNLAIDLGYYQDTSLNTNTVALNFNQAINSPFLNIVITGTQGKDNVTAAFGSVTDSYLNLAAYLYGGDDSFDATLGDIHSYAVAIAVAGGSGTDTLGVHVNGNIDAGAYLGVLLDGGYGEDTVNFDYQGVMNGNLYVALAGGPNKDTVAGNITLNSGSTGKVAAAVLGGDGDDTLTLNVFDNPGGTASVKALLDGGAGFDTCVHTSNVVAINCEA